MALWMFRPTEEDTSTENIPQGINHQVIILRSGFEASYTTPARIAVETVCVKALADDGTADGLKSQ